MPEENAAHPGLQRAGGGENGERRVRTLQSPRRCPEARSRARRGKGWTPRLAGRPQQPHQGGAPVSLTTAPGRSPSGPGEGRGEREGTLRRGGGGRRHLPGAAATSRVRVVPSGHSPRLPCIPAPGHSPRSERTGCRPPWPRQPAGGGRAGGGLTAAAAAPPPARAPRLPQPSPAWP